MFTIIVIYLANISIFCFISEVGTGSSSHDVDGDFMMSSLVSVTQIGSNTESLQCGSLCGCVCDRMGDTGGKERRMFSIVFNRIMHLKMHSRGSDRSV